MTSAPESHSKGRCQVTHSPSLPGTFLVSALKVLGPGHVSVPGKPGQWVPLVSAGCPPKGTGENCDIGSAFRGPTVTEQNGPSSQEGLPRRKLGVAHPSSPLMRLTQTRSHPNVLLTDRWTAPGSRSLCIGRKRLRNRAAAPDSESRARAQAVRKSGDLESELGRELKLFCQ